MNELGVFRENSSLTITRYSDYKPDLPNLLKLNGELQHNLIINSWQSNLPSR
jgi:hypothetical protein